MSNSYETCIKRNHGDYERMTWCGKNIGAFQFCFMGLDHAGENGLANGRLVACKDCTKSAIGALKNGQTND